MTILEKVAPRLAKAYYAERNNRALEARITEALPLLTEQFTGYDFDFILPLGDNWLWAWTWAVRLEASTGISHQAALHVAYERYFREHNQ